MANINLPKLTMCREFNTSRLIPTRFAEINDSVLAMLATNDAELNDLFELDNATNGRLIAQSNRYIGIGMDELVFGVPNAQIINAAFCYPRPEGSRFNDGQRGAWYCALKQSTALAEVLFHKTIEYYEINYFHDVRQSPKFAACLKPDSYIASQKLGAALLDAGSLGIIYPSARKQPGINIACFRPALVGNVRKGKAFEFNWHGDPTPRVKVLTKNSTN
jgi:hypothetical protein